MNAQQTRFAHTSISIQSQQNSARTCFWNEKWRGCASSRPLVAFILDICLLKHRRIWKTTSTKCKMKMKGVEKRAVDQAL